MSSIKRPLSDVRWQLWQARYPIRDFVSPMAKLPLHRLNSLGVKSLCHLDLRPIPSHSWGKAASIGLPVYRRDTCTCRFDGSEGRRSSSRRPPYDRISLFLPSLPSHSVPLRPRRTSRRRPLLFGTVTMGPGATPTGMANCPNKRKNEAGRLKTVTVLERWLSTVMKMGKYFVLQLWNTACNSNIEILQRFRNKYLGIIVNDTSPWHVTSWSSVP